MIEKTGVSSVMTWEDLRISGQIVIHRVLKAIQDADLIGIELSGINQNVMFELGYSIGSGKSIWVLRDPKWESEDRDFRRLETLVTLGYSKYESAHEIQKIYLDQFSQQIPSPLYDSLIEPNLQPIGKARSVFFLLSNHQSEAHRSIAQKLVPSLVAGRLIKRFDPQESAGETLVWFAQSIYEADATIAHFSDPDRHDSDVHNARAALACGLALGMGKPILMLAPKSYQPPIDYADYLQRYTSARHAGQLLEDWCRINLPTTLPSEPTDRAEAIALATELRSLRLGEHVAENEESILPEYFLDTPPYQQVLAGRTALYVGRKGTGKSATVIAALESLTADKRVVVVDVRPRGYEIESLASLMSEMPDRPSKDFLAESVWVWIILTEVAGMTVERLTSRLVKPERGTPEWELVQVVEGERSKFFGAFDTRLSDLMKEVRSAAAGASGAELRSLLGNFFYRERFPYLRKLLGTVLQDVQRVTVLVDNLDKAWYRAQDLETVSILILGLLGAASKTSSEFAKDAGWREPVDVTVSVFIREDISRRIRSIAREPDKLPLVRLTWRDSEALAAVVERRYQAAVESLAQPEELWSRFFDESQFELSVRDYVTGQILPRPRDLVFVCNAAIASAVAAGRPRIAADDMSKALDEYSQFALAAAQVEGSRVDFQLDDVLYEFVGENVRITRSNLEVILTRAGLNSASWDEAISELVDISFLGLAISADRADYVETSVDWRRTQKLAEKFNREEAIYEVHPAFRRFLELSTRPQ